MTLRTTAIIAGVLGLLMLVAGLVANGARADHEVLTQADITSPVVVLGPDVVALDGLERIAVTTDGPLVAHAARPVDALAWLKNYSADYVMGYDGWDTLALRTESRVTAPSASPSPSPGASASPSPSAAAPSPSPSASPSASPAPDAEEEVVPADYGSGDHWRDTWNGQGRVSLGVASLTPGDYLVVYSADGADLGNVEFTALRQVNDGWIDPLIWIGAALAALGIVASLSGLIDVRPVQERIEGWRRKRAGASPSVAPVSGSRRERRLAGSTLAPVSLDDEQVAPSAPLPPFEDTLAGRDVADEVPAPGADAPTKGDAL